MATMKTIYCPKCSHRIRHRYRKRCRKCKTLIIKPGEEFTRKNLETIYIINETTGATDHVIPAPENPTHLTIPEPENSTTHEWIYDSDIYDQEHHYMCKNCGATKTETTRPDWQKTDRELIHELRNEIQQLTKQQE